jgi:group II intron reverse transcriptase/maturase
MRETSTRHRTGEGVRTKLSRITAKAKGNAKTRFISLMYLLNEEFLEECYYGLKGDKAAGIDGETVQKYGESLKENLKDLVARMKKWQYRPKPARRVYIPKGNGKQRPLGIPAVEDKIVQMGLKRILEAIYEVDFQSVSYGFRPGRNCHQAVDALYETVMVKPTNYIADMDIEEFFDTVDHKKLIEVLKIRIADPNIIRLIGRFLRAGYMEAGKYYQTEEGTPQGGVLSPLLANIYLHYALDLWFEKRFKKGTNGHCQLIRYADDFVAAFQKKAEAERFNKEVRERLGRFGLKISEQKSRTIPFGRYPFYSAEQRGKRLATFDFLGFTFYCTKSRKGNFLLGRKTASKKYRQKIKDLKVWLKAVRNMATMEEWWGTLRRKLQGHYQYYGISGNMQEIRGYYWQVISKAFKWINRRSQKRSYNWCEYCRYLQHNPLPKPKIYRSYPVLW